MQIKIILASLAKAGGATLELKLQMYILYMPLKCAAEGQFLYMTIKSFIIYIYYLSKPELILFTEVGLLQLYKRNWLLVL
jgi:hypothetical protein